MATKLVTTPVRKQHVHVTDATLKHVRPQLSGVLPGHYYSRFESKCTRSPSGLKPVRSAKKAKRKPCAEAGVFPIKPVWKDVRASESILNTTTICSPVLRPPLQSVVKKTPTSARPRPVAGQTWNNLQHKAVKQQISVEGTASNVNTHRAQPPASIKSSKKRRSFSVGSAHGKIRSRIPVLVKLVRPPMVDPQVVADLEKEEEELMARLEDVREKLRRIKAPIVIRRPAIPTLFKHPAANPKPSMVQEVPNKLEVEESASDDSFTEYLPDSGNRRSGNKSNEAIQPESASCSPADQAGSPPVSVPPPSTRSLNRTCSKMAESPFDAVTGSPRWNAADSLCAGGDINELLTLPNAPSPDRLLSPSRAHSPNSIYNHLRSRYPGLNTPNLHNGRPSSVATPVGERSCGVGRPTLHEVALLNSTSKRVHFQLLHLFKRDD